MVASEQGGAMTDSLPNVMADGPLAGNITGPLAGKVNWLPWESTLAEGLESMLATSLPAPSKQSTWQMARLCL